MLEHYIMCIGVIQAKSTIYFNETIKNILFYSGIWIIEKSCYR